MRAPVIMSILLVGCIEPASAVAQDRIDPMAATVAQWFTMVER